MEWDATPVTPVTDIEKRTLVTPVTLCNACDTCDRLGMFGEPMERAAVNQRGAGGRGGSNLYGVGPRDRAQGARI